MYQFVDKYELGALLTGALLVFGSVGCASSDKSEESGDDRAAASESSQTTQQEQSSESGERSTDRRKSRAGQGNSSRPPENREPVSDAQLDDFARISEKIQKVKMRTRKKMENAESRDEASKYQKQAQSKVQKIFDNEEMSQQEYARIAKRLQRDEKLRRRLKKRVDKK